MMVKRSIDQKLRFREFDARNDKIETGAVVTSRRRLRGAMKIPDAEAAAEKEWEN